MSLPVRRRLALTAAVLTAVIGYALVAPSTEQQRTRHRDRDGVFSVSSGDGGALLDTNRIEHGTRSTTFGFFVTCTVHGERVRLGKVRWRQRSPDTTVSVYLRRVPSGDARSPGLEYAPGVVDGTPETATPILGGRFVPPEGQEVSGTSCDRPPLPQQPRDDFVVVVTAGPAGATVDDIVIEYAAGSRRYALEVGYTLVLCGSEVADPDC